MIKTLILPRHLGKTEYLINRLHEFQIKEHGVPVHLMVHALGKDEIEAQSVERVSLEFLGKRPVQLRRSAGKCIFSVLGYEHDEEELFLIPEVRAYFQLASRNEPHWLFSSRLSLPAATMIVLCCLDSFTCIRSASTVCVTYHTQPVREVLDSWTPLYRKLQYLARTPKLPMRRELRAFRRRLGIL